MMTMGRRRFLGGTAMAAMAPLLALLSRHVAAAERGHLLVSAMADSDGRYYAAGFDTAGARLFAVPLPGRGHAAAVRPARPEAVVLARRPGTFAVVLDLGNGAVLQTIDSAPDRHFFGHGVFSPDGRWLFTSENDYDGGRGVIGIRDATAGYRIVGEHSAHGIGPHDFRLLRDGRTLVVANGGIRTHPDYGREKLNLPTMAPSLAYIDSFDGRLLADYRLPPRLHMLSIRHLAVTDDDVVSVALQYEGPADDTVPLVGLHGGEDRIRLLEGPLGLGRDMRNYCGSACLDAGQTVLAASAPRGNLVTFWSIPDGAFLGRAPVLDGCGVAPTGRAGEFFITSGRGGAMSYDAATGAASALHSPFLDGGQWDNHLLLAA